MATKSANLYARIEPDVKEKAESILSTLGIPASSATKTSDSPKTGDNTNIYAYLAMLGLSCVGLGGMLYFKRRRKKL